MFDEAVPLFLQKYLGPPDERTSKWLLLSSPVYLFAILATYFATLIILHKWMKKRKAFELRKVLIVYNFFQVLYSAYICAEIFLSAYLADYKISCTPLDAVSKLGLRMANAFWLFYVSKIIDLTDTIFFVLRKKNKQITFLHIYHHSSMIFNWYLGVLYSPGGQAFFSVMFNSFVHVIMYLYYMLSAIGPKMQKYLWWKRYLTQIQLVQFLVVMSHLCIGLYNKCKAPFWLNWFTIIYLWTLVVFFGNFYYKAYKTKRVPAMEKKSAFIDYKAGGDFKYNKYN